MRLEQTVPVAALESLDTPWPTQPPKERGYRFQGYRLDKQGRPTFAYEGPTFHVQDQPVPVAGEEPSFQRHIVIDAKQPAGSLYFLAGASHEIKKLAEDRYLLGGTIQIRLAAAGPSPIIRTSNGRQELLVPVQLKDGKAEIVQEIVW